jgi:uncharacterized protein YbaA (DUF1428 family)
MSGGSASQFADNNSSTNLGGSKMYVSGFVIPVPADKQEAYRKMAADAGKMFKEYGALEIVEAWEEDVRDGKQTDFRRAVEAKSGEKIVFAWIVWPDKATSDKAEKDMLTDERMQHPAEMPFDGKRLIFGGFKPIYTLGRKDVN